jgi:hypothetical protein
VNKKRFSLPRSSVIALGLLALALGLGNVGRAVMALRYAARLPDLRITVLWGYLAAMGAFWGLAFVVCAIGLIGFRPRSRWLVLAAVTLYEAHVWINRLAFDASDYAHQTRPRDAVLTLLLLGLFWGGLNLDEVRACLRET